MLVFWWQGRGYKTILIWLVVMCAFGAVMAVGKSFIPDRPWYWGLAFIASAAVNWREGSKLNARSLRKHQPKTIWKRLFYRAAHRFMSMPMETFSVVLVIVGVGFALQGFLNPSAQ